MNLDQQKSEAALQLQREEALLRQLQDQKKDLGRQIQEKMNQQKLLDAKQTLQTQREIASKLIQGRTLLRSGDYEGALKEWDEVLLLDPNNETALAFISSCEKRMREEEDAKRREKQQLEQKAKEISAGWLEARKKYRQGLFEEALALLENIQAERALSPEMQELRHACLDRLKEVEAALGVAKKEAEERKREAQRILAEAREFAREGQWKDAVTFYEKAFLLEPDNRLIQEEWKRAETEFREWKKTEEKREEGRRRFEAEWNRVKAEVDRLCLQERLQEGLEACGNLLRDFPGSPEVLKTIQFLHKRIETTNEREEKRKQEGVLQQCLSETTRFLMSGKEDEAIVWCQKGLTVLPGHPDLLKLEQRLWIQKKQREEAALKRMERWEEEERQTAQTLLKIWEAGQEHWKQGRWRQALSDWERGHWVDPNNEILRECLAKADRKIREAELNTWKKEQRESENREKNHLQWMRGRALWREGKVKEALSLWEEIWEPGSKDTHLSEWIRKAEETLRRKERGERRVSSLIFGATRYFNRGQWSEALRCLEEALVLDSENVEVKNAILQSEEKLGLELPGFSVKEKEVVDETLPLGLEKETKKSEVGETPIGEERDDMDSLIHFLQTVRKGNDEGAQSKIKMKEWKNQVAVIYEDAQKLMAENRLQEARHLLESSLEMAEKEGVQSSLIARMKTLHQKLGLKTSEPKNVSRTEI